MIVSDTKWTPDLSNAGRSKYKALAAAIREGIVSGQLSSGEQLPPVRELAFRVGVTPGTVARAYSVLTDEGRLNAGVGRGTFVAKARGIAQPVLATPDAPVMLDPVLDHPEQAHLLSPKMPEAGQGALIRDAMTRLAQNMLPDQLLRYPSRDTDIAARASFAASVADAPVGPFELEDVVLANGGQSAIVMILQTVLTGTAPVIAVDELSYGGFRSAAMLCRAKVVGVPWDNAGPVPAALEHMIKTEGVQVFCTSAEVCNPIVRSATPERRQEIARMAERYGVHIVDDDCYRLMRTPHAGPSYRALLPDLGWYVTSPSKSITAALRIGFAIAARGWTSHLVRTSTFQSFGVTRLITDLYADIMAQPQMDAVMDGVQARIAQDVRAAVNILGRYQLTWSETVPFIWLELPLGWRAGEFCQAAEASGVLLKSADDFALRDSRSIHAVRIALNGQVSHERFAQAMRTLRDLLDHPPERISV
ncbi:aminotransferase-like domain-containing protein [Yoonia sp. 208BN28-4]|uniref:aminotransferase-like domain-containing protein n=1 Tax=Yoonia sp. 208BN28-4 TaxID=3126505 RepID=UPI00309C45FD